MLGKRVYQKDKNNNTAPNANPEGVDVTEEGAAATGGEQAAAAGPVKKKSILHKQIGKGSSMPTKRHINLYISDNQKKKVDKKAVVAAVLYVAAVLIFVKFLILDTMAKTSAVKKEYQMAEDNLEVLRVANKDFDEVLAQYSRFGNNFMKPAELAQRDRMEILDLIDRDFMGKDGLISVNVTDNSATMEITSELLADVSSLVKTLEDEPIVYYVTVSRAATQKPNGTPEDIGASIAAQKDVSATMTVYFVDQNAEEGTEETAETAETAPSNDKGGN